MTSTTYAIIGNGRMATHMVAYLGLLTIPTVHITWPKEIFQNAQNKARFQEIIECCDVILLLISDCGLTDFVNQFTTCFSQTPIHNKPLVHFSGQLVLEHAHSAHPLMSFGPELYDLAVYQKMLFVIEAEGADFNILLPHLPNPHCKIPRTQKPKYHSLCVLAANFSCLLWQKFFQDLSNDYQIPTEALLLYFDQVTHNIRSNPSKSLTGPLQRGDQATINANLQALEGDPYQAIYQSFVNLYEALSKK